MAEEVRPPVEPWFPTISVIVSTYKRPTLLRRALESVARQTFTDMEVFVVHDGQWEQDTQDVVTEVGPLFEDIDVPLALIATKEHTGYYTHPRNYATYVCHGDYVANLDDDNEWKPDHLANLVAAIEDGESWPDFVYSRREYVGDEGAPTEFGGQPLPIGPSPLVPWGNQAITQLNAGPQYNFVDSSDFMASRGALYRLGVETGRIWNENWRRYGDWEIIWRGVTQAGWRGKEVDAASNIYHWHASNIQTTRAISDGYVEVKA